MSGVYISGMEMPKRNFLDLRIEPDGYIYKLIGHNTYLELYKAIAIPDHGRLIDAEPIRTFITDGLNSGEFGYDQIKVLAEIEYAPTIIPADKGGAE